MKRFKEIQQLSPEEFSSARKLMVDKWIGFRLGETMGDGDISHFAPGLEKRMRPRRMHGEGNGAWEATSIGVEFLFVALDERETLCATAYLEQQFSDYPARHIEFDARVTEPVVINFYPPLMKIDGTRIVFKHSFIDASHLSEAFKLMDLTSVIGSIVRTVNGLRRPSLPGFRPALPPAHDGPA